MDIKTKETTLNDQPIRIHAISTGQVAVKTKFRESPWRGPLAILSFVLDRQFTEWMPIWVWVIEHPEGVFVIDTGENAQVNEPDYFRASGRFAHWLNTTQFKFRISREEEIDQQLHQIGLRADSVPTVILTHLHLDHFDGLRHFPNSRILVNQLEWEKPYGDLPKLYPSWFRPEPVVLNQSFEAFPKVRFLTDDQHLMMVETPGHTHGHTSVLLRTDEGFLLFAGDVVYYQAQLTKPAFCGGTVNYRQARQSYQRIREFAAHHPLVVLPSHDGEAAERLMTMQPLDAHS